MKTTILFISCLFVAVSSRSLESDEPIPDALISKPKKETSGLCEETNCADNERCDLRKNPDCEENCELKAVCVKNDYKANCHGENEELKKCGTACEPRCGDPEFRPCTKQCVINVCQCKYGYQRNSEGKCVLPDQCSTNTTCGENEKFQECGTACEPRCGDPEFRPCTMQCVNNVCQCKNGYQRNSEGKCVLPFQCGATKTCEENEEFLGCGTACEPSCDQPKPLICNEMCLLNVCQCKSGFVRDKTTKKCVKLDTCPVAACGKNEERKSCGNACGEPKCGGGNKDQICQAMCLVNVCQCKDGFVRNNENECVDVFACSANTTTCAKNETFYECGTDCEPSCENPHPTFCTKRCNVNVCQCARGFVRNGGQCTAESECPKRDYKRQTRDVDPCEGYFCPAETQCALENNKPTCVKGPSCATVRCSAGHECRLEQVFCIRAPCPKLPRCVPVDQSTY